ncbi:hypothetical protein P22_1177 [Propionispora sp. 2/2-37]|uniref:DeoR/GlpR family DNA-binding transcription regulator n=1 Tax=Propionispora sp. 2/2-37 TaxID=1677858 RepID=UPI0006BFD08A|nr:DeoR/GlpR family DNA-binding transcription regulator [Propionispora sp. 2/2-37]CUH95108.1 hypothetical protein P22_1177 [Propionispora sp. 2/2-37]
MMRVDRLNKMEELLEEVESVSMDKLNEIFQVSLSTLHRDLAELEKRGLIKKTYGGIVLKRHQAPEPFSLRNIKHQKQKMMIAKVASRLVADGDVIYIDSGTTTMHLIPYLAAKKNITIITANVHVINACTLYQQMNVIVTGGLFYPPANTFVGADVIRCLRNYNISKTFFAAAGFSIENGVTSDSPLECEIKQYLAEIEQEKILLAGSSKVGTTSLMTFCQLKDIDYLIMDQKPPQAYLEHFARHQVKLLTSDTEEIDS